VPQSEPSKGEKTGPSKGGEKTESSKGEKKRRQHKADVEKVQSTTAKITNKKQIPDDIADVVELAAEIFQVLLVVNGAYPTDDEEKRYVRKAWKAAWKETRPDEPVETIPTNIYQYVSCRSVLRLTYESGCLHRSLTSSPHCAGVSA
jgi:hypothetical protein